MKLFRVFLEILLSRYFQTCFFRKISPLIFLNSCSPLSLRIKFSIFHYHVFQKLIIISYTQFIFLTLSIFYQVAFCQHKLGFHLFLFFNASLKVFEYQRNDETIILKTKSNSLLIFLNIE